MRSQIRDIMTNVFGIYKNTVKKLMSILQFFNIDILHFKIKSIFLLQHYKNTYLLFTWYFSHK